MGTGSSTSISLELESDADASEGTWTLTLLSDARDGAGNYLDGAHIGSASDFVLEFGGDVGSAGIDVFGCEPSTTLFRPDGDDGAGDEADNVDLAVEGLSTPDWWHLAVFDEADESIFFAKEVGLGSTVTLSWDGRRQNGKIAPNGNYRLVISGADASLNIGTECEAGVELERLIQEPEAL